MENNEKTKLEEAGAFWIKKSKTGTQFLTGQIKTKSGEEIKVIVFKNKYKTEGSNQPDYRIYFDSSLPLQKKEERKENILKKEKVTNQQSEEIPF